MGRHKKVKPVSDYEEDSLPDVGETRLLSGKYMASFSGESYRHSLEFAREWVKREAKKRTITLVNYYPQVGCGGKSIIVSYNHVILKTE